MVMNVVGSGSVHGNCYTLTDSQGSILILDCGVKKDTIFEAIDFNVSKVKGVCVTHHHTDHSKECKRFENMGIKVWKPYEQKNSISKMCFGAFTVQTFPLTDLNGDWTHSNGDGSKCPIYGFMIKHDEIGKMLYITDTEYVKYNFSKSNIDHILIGCNYDKDAIEEDENKAKSYHVYSGHMELRSCIDFLRINKTENLKTVCLCHLSEKNADREFFKNETENALGMQVYVASKGLKIEME